MKYRTSTPWYKHRWPWLLMAGPAAVVVAGAVTIWLAVVSADGLVDDDYYKQGLAVNQRIHRDREAEKRQLLAQLAVGEDGRALRVMLQASPGTTFPDVLQLEFAHPTRAAEDRRMTLTAQGGGMYQGLSEASLSGRWKVTLFDAQETWRLLGTWTISAETRTISLSPP